MKTLSKNKQLFLKIVELVNKQLRNTDHHLSKAEAIALYDKEIAPYGYPSHQSLLIEKGMSMIQFNSEVVNFHLQISKIRNLRFDIRDWRFEIVMCHLKFEVKKWKFEILKVEATLPSQIVKTSENL